MAKQSRGSDYYGSSGNQRQGRRFGTGYGDNYIDQPSTPRRDSYITANRNNQGSRDRNRYYGSGSQSNYERGRGYTSEDGFRVMDPYQDYDDFGFNNQGERGRYEDRDRYDDKRRSFGSDDNDDFYDNERRYSSRDNDDFDREDYRSDADNMWDDDTGEYDDFGHEPYYADRQYSERYNDDRLNQSDPGRYGDEVNERGRRAVRSRRLGRSRSGRSGLNSRGQNDVTNNRSYGSERFF